MRKKNAIPECKLVIDAPACKPMSIEQASAAVLTTIRQLEPEDQNEVIKTVLSELAVDRHNSVRSYQEGHNRATKSMDTFMTYAMGIEKLFAMAMEKKG